MTFAILAVAVLLSAIAWSLFVQWRMQRRRLDESEREVADAITRHIELLFAKIDVQVPNPDQSDPDTPYVDDGLFFIYYGEGAQAVAEAIFGPSLRPGVTYSGEHLSRKQIVPLIMEILQ